MGSKLEPQNCGLNHCEGEMTFDEECRQYVCMMCNWHHDADHCEVCHWENDDPYIPEHAWSSSI